MHWQTTFIASERFDIGACLCCSFSHDPRVYCIIGRRRMEWKKWRHKHRFGRNLSAPVAQTLRVIDWLALYKTWRQNNEFKEPSSGNRNRLPSQEQFAAKLAAKPPQRPVLVALATPAKSWPDHLAFRITIQKLASKFYLSLAVKCGRLKGKCPDRMSSSTCPPGAPANELAARAHCHGAAGAMSTQMEQCRPRGEYLGQLARRKRCRRRRLN